MAEKSVYAKNRKQRPITVPHLHHATFMTMDVDKMVSWYEKVVGMQPVYYAEHAAWLTNDEANHRIALLRLPGTKPPVDKPHSAGLHHTAFEYKTFDMWIDNYARLADEGIVPELALHHGMTMSLYYVDPDGNGVEIQVDVFGDWGASKEWMWASQEFAADQIGRHFDPARLVEVRRDDMDPDEIQKRTYAGEFAAPPKDVRFSDVWPQRMQEEPALADGVPAPGEGPAHTMPTQ